MQVATTSSPHQTILNWELNRCALFKVLVTMIINLTHFMHIYMLIPEDYPLFK
jgi:hypothetical protein